MCKCYGNCNECKKAFKTNGYWCYDKIYGLPKAIDGPQKFGEYYLKQFWTFDYTEGEKI